MTNPQPDNGKPFDLDDRTGRFGESVIAFAKTIPVNPVTKNQITQLVDAATSVGANYCEADEAESRKDFRHKIGLRRKESKETRYWLRMVVAAVPELKESAAPLRQEAKEIHLIFCAIFRKADG